MKNLILNAQLTINLETLDEPIDDFDMDETIELLRIHLQEEFYNNDLEVQIFDWYIESDGDFIYEV